MLANVRSIDAVTDPLPTSCTCIVRVPIDNSTGQQLEESSASSACSTTIAVESSTDQPLAESSSSLWASIAVAIMLPYTLRHHYHCYMHCQKHVHETDGDQGKKCPWPWWWAYMSTKSTCIQVFETNIMYFYKSMYFLSVQSQFRHKWPIQGLQYFLWWDEFIICTPFPNNFVRDPSRTHVRCGYLTLGRQGLSIRKAITTSYEKWQKWSIVKNAP